MGILDLIQTFQQFANLPAILVSAAIGATLIWMYIRGRHLQLAAVYLLLTLFSGFFIPVVHLASTFLRWFLLILFTIRKRYSWKLLGLPAQLLVLFSLLALVTTAWSPNPMYGVQTAGLRLLMVFGMGGMIAFAIRKPTDIRRLFRLFMPVIAVWVVINLMQFRDFTGGVRFQGSTAKAALFVINGGVVFLVMLWMYLTEERAFMKYTAALLMIADLVLILMSGQRTGTYGAFIASGVFFVFGGIRSRLRMGMVIAMGLLTVLAILMLNPEQSWFLRERYGSLDTSGRGEILEWNIEKAMQHPWIGHGAGAELDNYEIVLDGRQYRHELVYFHNAFAEAFFQTGLGGLVLFAGAVFLFLWKSLLLTIRLPEGELRSYSRLLCSFAVYVAVTAFFEQTIISPSMILTFIVVTASTMLHHIEAWGAVEMGIEPVRRRVGFEYGELARS